MNECPSPRAIIVQIGGTLTRQHRMKLPTITSGIPQVSLRIVNEKQQLTNPSLPEVATRGTDPGPCLTRGLDRNMQEVNTAFCVESNATLPYF
jgi:hypothetical protein